MIKRARYNGAVNRTKAYERASEEGTAQSVCMYPPGGRRDLEQRRVTLQEFMYMVYPFNKSPWIV